MMAMKKKKIKEGQDSFPPRLFNSNVAQPRTFSSFCNLTVIALTFCCRNTCVLCFLLSYINL